MNLKISKHIKRENVAWYKGHLFNWKILEVHVALVRKNLLKTHCRSASSNARLKVLNLCEDKYHFLVVFTASMLEGRVSVMPSNRSEGELARIIEKNENIQRLHDFDLLDICQQETHESNDFAEVDLNTIPTTMIVAELYSSGTTGQPSVNTKTWGQLINGAQQVYSRFELNNLMQPGLIATVPPQHMFGFEMCIVMALVCGVTIHHDQPFYPLDIQQALNKMQAPRILITTPLHLKACNLLGKEWADIEFIISATAPMPENVAQQAEKVMDTEVREIYGCSEVGAIATRRLVKNPDWKLLPDYILSKEKNNTLLRVPTRPEFVPLPDNIDILPNKLFRLIGRNADVIKIGGKRCSLVEITTLIRALPGVDDAVVFIPEEASNPSVRLAALVVAEEVTAEQLRERLIHEIDPVFLPRPFCVVPKLPYNAAGKLPRSELLASFDHYMSERKSC